MHSGFALAIYAKRVNKSHVKRKSGLVRRDTPLIAVFFSVFFVGFYLSAFDLLKDGK